ncbi:MAG: SDR family NAD(P)-dependent oxidoreductase [Flavobacterium sp.]|uniref:SDR family NAD(P)-dependent oxidoreductase n=1 Tax=Flavobacterium sp. TaxID=239 RepID=UPI003BDCD336
MYNPFSLAGKQILVTGASSGIGRAVAIECSKLGAIVYITGRNVDNLNKTYLELEGVENAAIPADLTNINDLDTLVAQLPVLDGVVHSAGVSYPTPFPFVNAEKINQTFSVNFNAPVLLNLALLKQKKLNRKASILFISSISGVHISSPGGSVYSASKAAINGIMQGMAIDLAGKGIRVNSINPGMVETDILLGSGLTEEQLLDEKKKYPLKRFGQPNEIAYAAVYLLSDASQWVTGSNLKVDGGYSVL